MSTHNIYFHAEIRKILSERPLSSGAISLDKTLLFQPKLIDIFLIAP